MRKFKQVRLDKGDLLKDRELVIETAPGLDYIWIGCDDAQGMHCLGTVDLSELRAILPRIRHKKKNASNR